MYTNFKSSLIRQQILMLLFLLFRQFIILNMSYPSIEIICGKCGCVINKMINLKSIRDVLRPSSGRCNTCGIQLNATEFTVKMEKH
jgi:hypothetical protein